MEDRAPDGGWVAGGPALYSARMAAALGAEVTLCTTLSPAYDRTVLAGLRLVATPARVAPRYANAYDANGDRTQLLLAGGEPLHVNLAAIAPGVDALVVAPAYHELAGPPELPARLLALSLQGILRSVDTEGRVIPHPDPWTQVGPFLRRDAFAFFSEEDTAAPRDLARELAAAGLVVLLTRGYRGATLFAAGAERDLAAIPADPVDPTGAGDCFAAAFVVRMLETGDLAEACRFALAAGSLAVEAPGLEGIPTRAAIEARLAKVAA